MKEYLVIGKIIKVVGLKGELKVYPSTDFSSLRFKTGTTIYLGEEKKEFEIKNSRNITSFPLIILKDYEDINLVEGFVNQLIYIEKNVIDLPKNTYYFSDLINCEIIDQNSNYIGKVIIVEDYPAQRTLRVKTDGKDVLIPFVNAFIKNVDIENKKIYVNIIEGMLWKSMF